MQEILIYLPPLKPLLQIFLGLAVGLFLASLLEAFRLTAVMARLTRPFVRYAHLGETSSASFALALFSPASANALLGDALQKKQLTEKEVIISNLFNSLPSTITHIPTFFFMSFPLIGKGAVIYTAISLFTALFRTVGTVLVGRLLLPVPQYLSDKTEKTTDKETQDTNNSQEKKSAFEKKFWKQALYSACIRFRKRLPRLLCIGIPVYCLMYYLQFFGFFKNVENWLVQSLGLDFLQPESLGIIVLYMAAELRASLVAAGTVWQAGLLGVHEIVLALLIGNVLSTPMRGIRHQLPAYASYYPASFAVKLTCYNQMTRVFSMAIVAYGYYAVVF